MTEIILNEDRLAAPEIVWDVTPLRRIVERLIDHPTPPNGFRVYGRDLGELQEPLAHALSDESPLLIRGKSDFRRAIGLGIEHRAADQIISFLFARVSDWAQDRLNVYHRNGTLWDLGLHEIAREILPNDGSGSLTPSYLEMTVDAVGKALSGKIVLLSGSVYHESNYFKILLPEIIRRSDGAVWVLFDEHGSFAKFRTPAYQREYIDFSTVISSLAQAFNIDPRVVDRVVDKAGTVNNLQLLTGKQFKAEYEYLAQAADTENLDELPDVPQAGFAPVMFTVRNDKLAVSENQLGEIDPDISVAVAAEIGHLITDVTEHFGLSNTAPATARKLDRMRDVVGEVCLAPPTDGQIVRLGILAGALAETIEHDPEGLIESAKGSLKSIITQTNLFLNRFDAWRKYLMDAAHAEMAAADPSATSAALKLFSGSLDVSDVIDQSSRASLRSYGDYAREIETDSEKSGLFATAQNMLSVAAAFVKRQIIKAASDTLSVVYAAGGSWLILRWLIFAEPQIAVLANQLPSVFGWLLPFIGWAKTLLG